MTAWSKTHFPVVILGAGVAGLTAKKRLDDAGVESCVLEAQSLPGGHAKSHDHNGFVFDEGPHILFSDDVEMLEYIGAPQPSAYTSTAKIGNYWQSKLLSHPAYLDLQGVEDSTIVVEIAKSLTEAATGDLPRAVTYEQWLLSSQGKFVLEQFTEIYTRKYWRCGTAELDVDWLGARIHKPTGAQLAVAKAILSNTHDMSHEYPDLTSESHYLTRYTYSDQGFWGLFEGLQDLDVRYNSRVTAIDLESRTLLLETEETLSFDFLISTIPLDNFLSISNTHFAGLEKLHVTSFVTLDFVFQGKTPPKHGLHWLYVYDESTPISRVSFPDQFLKTSEAANTYRVQCEIYWDADRESKPHVDLHENVDFLRLSEIIPEDAVIVQASETQHPYGNIVPTLGRQQAVEEIQGILSPKGVHLAGRFGRWQYLWTVEAARDGHTSALKVLEELSSIG